MSWTLELRLETGVLVTVSLITQVTTLVTPITDLSGVSAVTIVTLELSRSTVELRTRVWFILPVSTVILTITPPPEVDALELVAAEELTLAAVSFTTETIHGQDEVIGTSTNLPHAPIDTGQ